MLLLATLAGTRYAMIYMVFRQAIQLSCPAWAPMPDNRWGLPARPVLPDPLRVLRLQYLHPGPAGYVSPTVGAAGAVGGARTGGRWTHRRCTTVWVARTPSGRSGERLATLLDMVRDHLCWRPTPKSAPEANPRVDVAGVLHDPARPVTRGCRFGMQPSPEVLGNLGPGALCAGPGGGRGH